mgnify:CR=1 FL=1
MARKNAGNKAEEATGKAAKKSVGGAVGKGGVNAAPVPDNHTVRVAAEQLLLMPIDELVPYANNAKIHTPEQINQIRGSLREFGFVTPVLIDFDNNIIAGHGRVLAARAEGMAEVPCVMVSNLTEAQRKAYILADNRMSEIAQWDMKALEIELTGLQELEFNLDTIGFDEETRNDWFPDGDVEEDEAKEAEDDDYDGSVPETCPYKPGDVFKLGRHLLVCGDCTCADSVQAFGGAQVNLLLTDPPYNVDYTGKTKDALRIQNDSMDETRFTAFCEDAFAQAKHLMAPGAGFYIWHADLTRGSVFRALDGIGWTVREVLVWNKNAFVLGRQDYHWKHEPCLYGWNDGAAHYWNGGRDQSTVLEFDRPNRNAEHPTMKPIPLFDRLIRNSCPPDGIVLDIFGGSGTTLLACEQNGRTCYMIEMDPRYISVIIQRWEALTGQKAVQIHG